MFWNSAAATSVNFEVLLSKEDVTLQEIMDDDGVLQECRSQNNHLISYLVQSDVLEKLVRLTIEEPSGDEDDAVKYKYSNIACELLTCEVPPLSESLANDKALLGKLYSFLDTDAPLNPLLASFFSKTLSVLITRNSERNLYSYQFTCLKVLEFLKLKEDSISLLLKHLGTSAIMDLILKLVTKIEGSDLKEIAQNWLDEQKLIQRIVALLDPSIDPDRHYNAAQLLCDLINVLRNNKMEALQQNIILDIIESPEVVNLILDHILKEPKCETSIVGGISVLLVLLEDKWNGNGRIVFDETARGYVDYLKVVESTAKAILPRLKDFHDILINPPAKPSVRTTITVLDPPLGIVRVEVAKLFSVLITRDNVDINNELIELGTLNVLLDLFFKYTWNNFLHTQVQKCLINAFNLYRKSEDVEIQKKGLVAHILSKCRLLQRILEAWKDNETQQTEHKRPRRGYMGHLIEIAKKIVRLAQTHSFGALMKETVDNETLSEWENFINTNMYDLREPDMGGNYCLPEKDGVGKNGSFGDFSQVLYSNYYQLQSMTPGFTGDFGSFPDNQTLASDSNDIGDRDFPGLENSSSDEDNEDNLERNKNLGKDDDPQLEFYKISSWPGETDMTSQPADCFNPWSSTGLNDVVGSDLDWANFESAPFVANFGLNFNDINTTIATSSSHDIDTIPLALTPNENNSNFDDMFSNKEAGEQEEVAKVVENNPTAIEFTDLEGLTNAMKNLSTEAKESDTTEGGDTIPLALTPNENNSNFDDMFSNKEAGEQEEVAKVVENNPTAIEFLDLEGLTNAMKNLSTEAKESDTTEGGEDKIGKVGEEEEQKNIIETTPETAENDKTDSETKTKASESSPKADDNVNCVETTTVVGYVNSLGNKSEDKELDGNLRFLSSQGLTTNNEREPEGGDSYQILKENVQTVPNETTQSSENTEVKSSNPEDKSANGPI